MILNRLLGRERLDTFLADYLFHRPYSLAGAAGEFAELGAWPVVESVYAHEEADVMIVRGGRRWEGTGKPPFAEVRRLFDEGHTLLIRHAERHHGGLAELAAAFHRDFRAEVNVHIYCTPPGEHGFGWHYDAEDVFILQTQGVKEYSLRKNTVNPWPLVDTLPADMKFERELMPLMKCRLAAGDWLYIPNGYWHVGLAEEDAISLAIGVLSLTGIDVLDFLRRRLLDSMLWRQRLPLPGEAASLRPDELLERYRRILSELGRDAADILAGEPFVRSFLAEHGVEVSR